MQTYTYVSKGKFELTEKPKPVIMHERDAIVKVTLASICSSDLHIKHGSVPRAVPGITVGHEMVGIVEEVGEAVTHVKPGDRVTVNVVNVISVKKGMSITVRIRMADGLLDVVLMAVRLSMCVYRSQIRD